MTHIKLSFALILILPAIGISIVAHTGILKNTKLSPANGDCYTKIDIAGTVTQVPPCNPTTISRDATTCVTAGGGVGKHISGVTIDVNFPVIILADISAECPGGSTFCCAQLVSYPPPIPTPPCKPQITIDGQVGYFKIEAVYCKTAR